MISRRPAAATPAVKPNQSKLDSIPDIDNRFLSLADVLQWLDQISDAGAQDENISNK